MDLAVLALAMAAALAGLWRGLGVVAAVGRPASTAVTLRWWTLPSGLPLLAVALLSAVATPIVRPAGLAAAAVCALGPPGLGIGARPGIPSALAAPRCGARLAVAILPLAVILGAVALLGPAAAATVAVLVALLAPSAADLAAVVVPGPPVLLPSRRVDLPPRVRSVDLAALADATEDHRVAVLWHGGGSGEGAAAAATAAVHVATDVVLVGRSHRAALQAGAAAGPSGRRVVVVDDPDGALAWLRGEVDAGGTWAVAWDGDLPPHLP